MSKIGLSMSTLKFIIIQNYRLPTIKHKPVKINLKCKISIFKRD